MPLLFRCARSYARPTSFEKGHPREMCGSRLSGQARGIFLRNGTVSDHRRWLLQKKAALLLGLRLVDVALGATLLQNRHGARRRLPHLRLFAATRFPATAAHKHGQVLHSVTEIISPSCPFPNESLSGYSYPKLSNCWRSMRKPSRPLDGRIETGSLGLGCQHVRHQAPEKVLYRTSRRLLRLHCINLFQER